MAKLLLEMDTVTKEFTVSLDGKEMDNVQAVNAYRRSYGPDGQDVDEDEDLCHLEIVRRTPDEDNGLVVYERTCASEKGVEVKTEAKKPSTLKNDIVKFLEANRQRRR